MTNGERAAVFVLAAFLADDTLYCKLYLGTAMAYISGAYDRETAR